MDRLLWIAIDFGMVLNPAPAPEPAVRAAEVVVMDAAPAPLERALYLCVGPEGSLDNPLTPEYEPGQATMWYIGTEPAVVNSPNCERVDG